MPKKRYKIGFGIGVKSKIQQSYNPRGWSFSISIAVTAAPIQAIVRITDRIRLAQHISTRAIVHSSGVIQPYTGRVTTTGDMDIYQAAAGLRSSLSPWAKWHLSPNVQEPLLKFSHSLVLKLLPGPPA